ncbi:phage head-tail connector protein [Aerococcus kribbianus]|uniref:Phage head-tail connector protein n=1 Tax=Aerococcus kribbianus TaxID=2999064 RepID=A0A9X3FPY5_9LACT|nr:MULTISPECIES: phage head-tail connector protein [unclassified Aerococcus]MCZ0717834.1 phage head-tail connector protein [Aerococcus sp. YH-aer221]MCZ0726121.1 phage head-tail connector protein [Aerococcus sp. YH-aer222]
MAIDQYIEELKQFLRIFHSSEDDYLLFLLSASNDALSPLCGLTMTNNRFKELVFNRVRYAYNGDLEFFSENYQSEILDLSLMKLGEEDASTI